MCCVQANKNSNSSYGSPTNRVDSKPMSKPVGQSCSGTDHLPSNHRLYMNCTDYNGQCKGPRQQDSDSPGCDRTVAMLLRNCPICVTVRLHVLQSSLTEEQNRILV